MEEFNETLEELESKINEYEKQLVLVRNEIKKYDDVNEKSYEIEDQIKNLKKLESDMIEVISLTHDLINYKKQNEINFDLDNSKKKEKEDNLTDLKYQEEDEESKKLIEKTCSFMHDNKRVYGKIEKVMKEKYHEQLLVQVFGTKEKILISKKYIQLNEPIKNIVLNDSTKYQALYEGDGQWYDCNILKQKNDDLYVTYLGCNYIEYIKNDQIRIKKKKNIKEITTPSGYKIPENLIIKETDSLNVKARKKKKINALKKKQKNELLDKQSTNKAKQWRKFHEKTINKNKALLLTHKKLETSDNKITNFNIRRKNDYNDNEE